MTPRSLEQSCRHCARHLPRAICTKPGEERMFCEPAPDSELLSALKNLRAELASLPLHELTFMAEKLEAAVGAIDRAEGQLP